MGASHRLMPLERKVSVKFFENFETAAGASSYRPSQHLLFVGRSRNGIHFETDHTHFKLQGFWLEDNSSLRLTGLLPLR